MPQYFHFRAPHNITFDGQLHSHQCTYILKNDRRCKRRVVIGLPCCASHLPLEFQVQVRKSNIQEAGKGLFCYDPDKGSKDVVFRNNNYVCPYAGEIISKKTLEQRYGLRKHGQDNTAPYAIELAKHKFEDGALERGVGTLINHNPLKANVEFILDGKSNRVFLEAIKDIRNNEELYIDYGKEYKISEANVSSSTNNKKMTV